MSKNCKKKCNNNYDTSKFQIVILQSCCCRCTTKNVSKEARLAKSSQKYVKKMRQQLWHFKDLLNPAKKKPHLAIFFPQQQIQLSRTEITQEIYLSYRVWEKYSQYKDVKGRVQLKSLLNPIRRKIRSKNFISAQRVSKALVGQHCLMVFQLSEIWYICIMTVNIYFAT